MSDGDLHNGQIRTNAGRATKAENRFLARLEQARVPGTGTPGGKRSSTPTIEILGIPGESYTVPYGIKELGGLVASL